MCRAATFLSQKVCSVASEQTCTQALVTNYVVQNVSKQLSEFVVPVKFVISRETGSCVIKPGVVFIFPSLPCGQARRQQIVFITMSTYFGVFVLF